MSTSQAIPPCCRESFFLSQPLSFPSSKTLQYKSYPLPFSATQEHDIKRHICSFLNAEGGCILIINSQVHQGKSQIKVTYYTQQLKKCIVEYFRLLGETIKPDGKEVRARIKVEFVPLQTSKGWIQGGYVVRIRVLRGNRRELYFFTEKNVDYYCLRRNHETINITTKEAFEDVKNRIEKKEVESKVPTHFQLCVKPHEGHPVNTVNPNLKLWGPYKTDKKQIEKFNQPVEKQSLPSQTKLMQQKSQSQKKLYFAKSQFYPSPAQTVMATEKFLPKTPRLNNSTQPLFFSQNPQTFHHNRPRQQICYFMIINFTQNDLKTIVTHQPNYGFDFAQKQSIAVIYFEHKNYDRFIEIVEVIKKQNVNLLVLAVTNKLSFEGLNIASQIIEEFFILMMRTNNEKGFSLHEGKEVYLANKKIIAKAFLMLSDNGIRPRFKS